MERTRARPLPAGALEPARALAFGLALAIVGTALLLWQVGPAAALISVSAILVYIFAYTLWLKPRTPFAVVVGGFSGAIAPLIADAAIDGRIGLAGVLLFAIIFVWQPPHFYAIALFRRDDYARAGFPMLPERIGVAATCSRILLWCSVLIPVTLLPVLLPMLGVVYLVAALGLGALLFDRAVRLRARPDDARARGFFRCSLVHLMGLFAAMILDLALALPV